MKKRLRSLRLILPFTNNQQQLNTDICLHEYGFLLRGGNSCSLKMSSLSESEFDWLINNEAFLTGDGLYLLKPVIKQGARAAQVQNYVGVISLPSGRTIEILPKTSDQDDLRTSRLQLIKMLFKVSDLPLIELFDASLQTINRPLLEVLIGRFLQATQHLINKGLRSSYITVRDEATYLKGRLLTSPFLRRSPQKRMSFPVEYDDYLLSRPENRLIHWAVNVIYHWSRDQNHRSHARKLLTLFSDIPKSSDPLLDLKQWQNDRLMQHYSPVKPWITLIVKAMTPWAQAGASSGISLLFPMEKLFEEYVAQVLRASISPGFTLKTQSHAGYLAEHNGELWFLMKPDFLVFEGKQKSCVLDTKWKIVDSSAIGDKYGISQADMYQLFAYGHKCIDGQGSLFLVYPKSKAFEHPLKPFILGKNLKLWVIPFCLDSDRLVPGEWSNEAPYLGNHAKKNSVG
jgi:5-methylcytosine-specific restriction enzyme subunit McrC